MIAESWKLLRLVGRGRLVLPSATSMRKVGAQRRSSPGGEEDQRRVQQDRRASLFARLAAQSFDVARGSYDGLTFGGTFERRHPLGCGAVLETFCHFCHDCLSLSFSR